MRKVILAALLLAICTEGALAAKRKPRHTPAYAPPPEYVPMPPPSVRAFHDWTGFYVGGNVGGGWATTKSEFSAGGFNFATATNSLPGVIGGVQAGYNWQTGPSVLGVEADFQFSSQRGSLSAPTCPTPTCAVATSATYTQKMPWFGTVRGRAGFAQDGWMAYATAGYAYARLDTDATATAGAVTATVSDRGMRSGWTAGAGIEVALTRNWSARMEYLYMDFGRKNVTWTFNGIATPITDQIKLNDNLVRAAVSYRF